MSSTILHALDIGEYKIRCFSAIAESGDKTSFKILGFSEADNSAMINGNNHNNCNNSIFMVLVVNFGITLTIW